MNFLQILLPVFFVLAIVSMILYIPRIKYFFSAFHKVPKLKNTKHTKFAVIIPARNESGTVEHLLKSFAYQTYPAKFFDVFVVVADPNDPTCEYVALHHPEFKVFVNTAQKCKADALDFAISEINKTKKDYQAYVIVDADNILDPDYLKEMNNAFASGKDIILPRKRIKNAFDTNKKSHSLFAFCSGLMNAMNDDLGNKYRDEKGIPDNICGQGMLVSKRVIDDFGGWKFNTLIEDYELKAMCILKGYTTMYYPYAIVYAEEPTQFKQTMVRRIRWLTGAMQCMFKYTGQIKKLVHPKGKPFNKGAWEYVYIIWPIVLYGVVAFVSLIVALVGTIALGVMGNPLWFWGLVDAFVVLLVSYLGLLAYTGLSMKATIDSYQKLSKCERLRVMLYNPVYLVGYLVAFVIGFFGRNKSKWSQIKRIDYQNNGEIYGDTEERISK